MSSSSSDSNDSNESNSSDESAQSSVIQKWPPIRPKCRFVVKGGDVDDYGALYEISFESPFHYVYADYARRVGVSVREVKLFIHQQYISPDTTPFVLGFIGNELVLAYGEDMRTPLPVKNNGPASHDLVVFNIIDMMGSPTSERLVRKKSYKLIELYKEWGARRDVPSGSVTLFLKGLSLDHFVEKEGVTLHQAGIFD